MTIRKSTDPFVHGEWRQQPVEDRSKVSNKTKKIIMPPKNSFADAALKQALAKKKAGF